MLQCLKKTEQVFLALVACTLLFTAQGPNSPVWGEEAAEQSVIPHGHFPGISSGGVYPLSPFVPGKAISSLRSGLQYLLA